MKQFLTREKFKTETGRQLFDALIDKAPDLDELYMTFAMVRGDEKRKKLLDFVNSGHSDWDEIDDFVIEQWG